MKKEKRHNYEYEVDLSDDSAPARVIRMVGNNKYVLEIGAGPGSITKHLKEKCTCNVIALEIDEDAIVKLSPFCEKVYRADLNDKNWPSLLDDDGKFDVIVAADVLEHVYDPWATLAAMKGLLKDDGYLVVSLPHVGHSAVVACLLDEDFDYRDWGLLDRTHIRFFGLKNIQKLFNDADLSIEEAQFVIVTPETSEFSSRWNNLPANVKAVVSSFRHGNIYQVVTKVTFPDVASDNVDLMSLPVNVKNSVDIGIGKKIARKLIPETIRKKLRGVVYKMGITG